MNYNINGFNIILKFFCFEKKIGIDNQGFIKIGVSTFLGFFLNKILSTSFITIPLKCLN